LAPNDNQEGPILGYLSVQQHGSEQNEVAEFWMYHIAMDAHVTEAGGYGNGFV
jgi:hypothetical protein